MGTVTQQLDLVLSTALPPPPVRVAISEAQGLLCAEEVIASAPLPAFDQAAVDGYAVRSVDVHGASPVNPIALPVVGEIDAGTRSAHRLQPHQCVYVATGAPLPTIADAVVPRSAAERASARVNVTRAVGAVRPADRRGRAARGRRRPFRSLHRVGPGRPARRRRPGQGAGPPEAAAV